MLGDRKAISEQLSLVREEAGYDEVYPLGHGLEEGFSWSSKREPSAHSLDDEREVMTERK